MKRYLQRGSQSPISLTSSGPGGREQTHQSNKELAITSCSSAACIIEASEDVQHALINSDSALQSPEGQAVACTGIPEEMAERDLWPCPRKFRLRKSIPGLREPTPWAPQSDWDWIVEVQRQLCETPAQRNGFTLSAHVDDSSGYCPRFCPCRACRCPAELSVVTEVVSSLHCPAQ